MYLLYNAALEDKAAIVANFIITGTSDSKAPKEAPMGIVGNYQSPPPPSSFPWSKP